MSKFTTTVNGTLTLSIPIKFFVTIEAHNSTDAEIKATAKKFTIEDILGIDEEGFYEVLSNIECLGEDEILTDSVNDLHVVDMDDIKEPQATTKSTPNTNFIYKNNGQNFEI